MIRRFVLALGLVLSARHLLAVPADALVIAGDHLEGNTDTQEENWSGSVTVKDGLTLLTANRVDFREKINLIIADGRVTLTRGDLRLLADHLVYHPADGSFTATHVRAGRYPFYVEGLEASGTRTEVTIHHAKVTYGEPGPWAPTLKAETIVYTPDHYLRMISSMLGVGGTDFLPIPRFGQDLESGAASPYLTFGVGYRSTLGGEINVGLRLPVAPGAQVGADLGLYTNRGAMLGPAGTYKSTDDSGDLLGSLESGFIHDYGNRGTDILGNSVPSNRGFAEWQHQQQVTDDITIDGELNWWSDSEVLRDFRPTEFYPVQMPDNYLEAVDTGEDSFTSLFVRYQPNSFEPVQERLPELSYDFVPSAIGGGFYERFDTSAVSLEEFPPGGGAQLASNRIDAFYGLSRPFSPSDWFTFTPVAGFRLTNYSDTIGAIDPGGYTRMLGEIGFDTQLRSSGTFDYKNPTWDIDGLRHLLTPYLTYRYIPDANKGSNYIPDIDQQTFTTYLPPLDLGDMRYIDNLEPVNTLRLGVNNTLQTRDPTYGSRDLLTFDIANDFNFTRQPDEPDVSDTHTEIAFTPAPWITYGLDEIFDPLTFTEREFDSSLTLRDSDAWSLELANDFLRHEDDDYLMNFRLRLNEAYEALVMVEYGAREHTFNELATGIVQTLSNTWDIRYLVSFNGGPNREGHFGFTVQVDAIKF